VRDPLGRDPAFFTNFNRRNSMQRYVYMMAIMTIGLLFCLSSAPADDDDTAPESGQTTATTADESPGEAERGDRPGAAELAKNREARKKFFQEMRQKVEAMQKLQSEGKEEEAARLRDEIHQLRGQMRDSLPPGARPPWAGRPRDPEKAKQHRETMEKIMQAYREVRRLKEEGKTEEAEQRMAELKELRQQIARQGGHHHRHGGPHADPKAARRHHELREKIRQAKESGDEEKVRELMQQARASGRHFHPHPHADRDRRAPGSGPSAHPGSAEKRVHHLHIAAANLDAAGMREMAERVRRAAQEQAEQIRRRREQSGQGAMQDMQRNLRELKEEVRHLRRQVEELAQDSQ
jgi:soluble cytochrome b562